MSEELNFLGGEAPPEAEDAPAAKAASTPMAPGHVPLSAMLDEREKRQALEREVSSLRAHLAPPAPVPLEDHLEARLYAANLNASRRFAEREHGKAAVGAVHDWAQARCDADPFFNQQMLASEDPYEAAIQAYHRERIAAEVSAGDLDAFRAWKSLQGQATSHSFAPAPIPRSLATAPGNGAHGAGAMPVGQGSAYAGLFK